MWSLDFSCEIIRKEASADDSLELKFRRVKHLRDTGLGTGDPRRDLLLISYQAASSQFQGLSVSGCRQSLSEWCWLLFSVSGRQDQRVVTSNYSQLKVHNA